MKLPFSYKSSPFRGILLASLLTHTIVLGFGGGGLLSPPRFAVRQAKESVEVVLLKENPIKEERRPEPSLLSLEKQMSGAPVERERKRAALQKKKIRPEIHSLPRGAEEKARLDYLKNPAPVYPLQAREAGWEGQVVLKVFVKSDGRIGGIRVVKSSGYKILDQSALKAVKKWRFLPARMARLSFSSWIKIPVRFHLVDEYNHPRWPEKSRTSS